MSETRYAVVRNADSLTQLEAYLPSNYHVKRQYAPTVENLGGHRPVFLIEGEDNAGWTLDGYVIPRLASGLIWAEEVGHAADERHQSNRRAFKGLI